MAWFTNRDNPKNELLDSARTASKVTDSPRSLSNMGIGRNRSAAQGSLSTIGFQIADLSDKTIHCVAIVIPIVEYL